jgi:hypothetical protein
MATTATLNSRQNQVQWASGLNVLAAIWLFISAFAVAAHGSMMTNNIILGIAVFVLALFRFGGAYAQSWISWVNLVLGIWVIVSPWVVMSREVPATQDIMVNNVITGVIIGILAIWSALASSTEPGAETTYSTASPRPSYGR